MEKQSIYVRLLSGFGAFALCLSLLLTSLFAVSYDLRFYEKEYTKMGQAQVIGVSDETLMGITRRVVAYLRGDIETLDMKVQIDGEWEEVFGEREKAHMVDVLYLFKLGRCAQWIGFLLFAACTGVSLLLCKGSLRKRLSVYGLNCIFGCAAFLVLLGFLAIVVSIDFDAAFIRFHHIFFDNDLWLLDPETDILIMMVPEQFFMDCVARIALYAVLFYGAVLLLFAGLFVLGLIGHRQTEKRTQTEDIFSALGLDDDDGDIDKIGDVPVRRETASTGLEPRIGSQSIELPIRVDHFSEGQGVVLQLRMELHMVGDRQNARLELIPGSVPQIEITPRSKSANRLTGESLPTLAGEKEADAYAKDLKTRIRHLIGEDEQKTEASSETDTEQVQTPDIEQTQEDEMKADTSAADLPETGEKENADVQDADTEAQG